ncbi:DUF418 domain-containing protein [Hellea sp.]|nr:DUF418 domain-containing protein [Hellea sp.]
MNYVEQSQAAGRHVFPDLTRAFALIGIVLVNVGAIAFPMMKGYIDGGLNTPLDQAAMFSTTAFFLLKSYTLFSFMFGVGFAYQMQSAERHGTGFAGRYWRRVFGLLVLGLLHVALLFQGDILVMYAILGSILFLFRKSTVKTLKRWAISIYSFQVVLVGFGALAQKYVPEEMAKEIEVMKDSVIESRAVFGDGTFIESVSLRFAEWSEIIIFGMMIQGFGALAFFLFGLAAVRADIITNPSAPIWKKFRRIFLPIGIAGSLAAAYVFSTAGDMMGPDMMLAMALVTLFAPFSTAGYLGLIAKWAEGPMTPFKTFIARGGTASLTAYLMQGLILSLIFNNYGLGLYREIGAAGCVLIALLTGIFTVSFTSLWRKKFTRGPMEYLLRSWTYLGTNKN